MVWCLSALRSEVLFLNKCYSKLLSHTLRTIGRKIIAFETENKYYGGELEKENDKKRTLHDQLMIKGLFHGLSVEISPILFEKAWFPAQTSLYNS